MTVAFFFGFSSPAVVYVLLVLVATGSCYLLQTLGDGEEEETKAA
jgi:hypothetical protein